MADVPITQLEDEIVKLRRALVWLDKAAPELVWQARERFHIELYGDEVFGHVKAAHALAEALDVIGEEGATDHAMAEVIVKNELPLWNLARQLIVNAGKD